MVCQHPINVGGEKSGLGNIKAKLMGQKLIDWCQGGHVPEGNP